VTPPSGQQFQPGVSWPLGPGTTFTEQRVAISTIDQVTYTAELDLAFLLRGPAGRGHRREAAGAAGEPPAGDEQHAEQGDAVAGVVRHEAVQPAGCAAPSR
jgi:hypothetical protein